MSASHFEKKTITVENSVLLQDAQKLLCEGREVILMTKGNSMLPTLKGGRDSVVLRKMDSYSAGDVVLARTVKGHYVLHRILRTDGNSAVLKGDGNLRGTEECAVHDIYAKAVQKIRSKGECERDPQPISDAMIWNRLPYIIKRTVLAVLRRTQTRKEKEFNTRAV